MQDLAFAGSTITARDGKGREASTGAQGHHHLKPSPVEKAMQFPFAIRAIAISWSAGRTSTPFRS
jgi:hypothetical protein